ncbi:hypothetical protein LV779_07225 [Streptomyces thinghirensis]|nr:hypothetical protein [Streptomyces thinghirensis]
MDCLQADVTRCGGITGVLEVAGLVGRPSPRPVRALRPGGVRPHAFCAVRSCGTWSTSTTTCASSGCCSTASLSPDGGALRPDTGRPGLGLEVKWADRGAVPRARYPPS